MKNRLTERDLSRIVRRVIGNESRKKLNEMTYDLRTDIMDIIRDSNASNEEVISILNSIADEMSSSRRYCKGDNEELDYLKRKARMEIESYLF